ncbi:OmpA family protein [Bizionia paragorgiae]|uniref:OmpA family protein n=1 Tax=Bizionia paragorgiae TaxID=283786 RepID=UPI00299E7D36|nr:OmpA family protein [Bizionia paragorgiae]MDX1270573.1 OmpA family protein [Bizionia paragorgiae]
MKPFGYLLIAILCTFCVYDTTAQTKNNPWTASFGTNVINNPVRDLPGEEGRFKTWNWNAGGFRLSVGHIITNRLYFEGVASLNTVTDNYKTYADDKHTYASIDGMFKYHVTRGLFSLDPYVTLGGGYTWLDTSNRNLRTVGSPTINGGVGVNFWLSSSFGFTAQTQYKYALETYGLKHFQHSAGITYRFGEKDSDNDGINDNEDKCPDLFGMIETGGCPDRDGDGVIDSEDLCPDDFGPPHLSGCPDRDGDGTPDKYDLCPDEPGAIDDDGCPRRDSDNDGVDDRFDKCPLVPGPRENSGCPDPEQQARAEAAAKLKQQIERDNEIKNAVVSELAKLAKLVTFDNGKITLTAEATVALDEVAEIMIIQKFMKFHVAGHTDNTGNKAKNLMLSEQRASAVRDYLLFKGLEANRITSQGYGQDNPIADNSTAAGRLKNRRIEIFVVN